MYFTSALECGNRQKLTNAANRLKELKKTYEKTIIIRKEKKKKTDNNAVNASEPSNAQGNENSDNGKPQAEDNNSSHGSGEWEFDDPFEHGCTEWGNCTEEGDGNAETGTGW